MKKRTELLKHDILSYYCNTYIGLSIVLLLIVCIKFEMIPFRLCVILAAVVMIKIIIGNRKHVGEISCPHCGIGSKKKKWFANLCYRIMLPLEKEEFECPYCKKTVEIVDK